VEIAKPFIQLPYAFDASRLADEVNALDGAAWMQHPGGMTGNSAVALLSREGGDNDDFVGAMIETPHLKQCPYIRQVMASFGEVFGRSRLMKLAAGNEVSLHVDLNYHWYTRVRIHIPVITNPDVIFYCGEEQINMQAGESWIFNAWRRHRVINGGDKDRVHLVIDTSGSSRFWDTVSKMADLDRDADQVLINQMLTKIPYRENEGAVIRAERFNIAPIMSPGEIDALVRELIEDFERADENDRDRIAQYKSLLTDFAKDWRQLWLLFGYQQDGWPEYKALIDRTVKRMHPDRNALITSTNKVGVNPIIMQRIFWPALSVDHYDQFIGGEDSKS
jgi:hypothetical protein